MDKQLMMEKLKKKLPAKRYEHSIGVMYTAAAMAMVHDVDIEKALTAGLLHDCAKYLDNDTKIEKCKKHGLSINQYEYANPELLHAKLSALYAKNKYEIDDSEILSAITYHTTGKPAMNKLEKIIFIADFIEPNRRPLMEIDVIRKEAFDNLDLCVYHILKNTLNYLKTSGATIDDTSSKTYEYYYNKISL